MLYRLRAPISAVRRGTTEFLVGGDRNPLRSGRHRKVTTAGGWQGALALRGGSGRHRRVVPTPLRTGAARALMAGATATVLAMAAAPAHAQPAPPQIDALLGLPRDVLANIGSLAPFSLPGVDLPGLELPALFSPATAIVVLGYGLEPDGEMRPELENRLYAGYVSALLSPESPVIVTGGNPQNGVTEASAMAQWLIDRGISAARVFAETQANSTVQNAAFSAQLMETIGARAAILITSADHIARALSNFRAAGIAVVATMTPDVAPMSAQPFGPGIR
ncbi:YdcF family protein [Nocardia jejuensis]|uniref:YdcF family protein n=1 Tax=Nocardia jejuensis TaxID=328049 RepID=UPI000A41D5BD|nr:YdcF family protein [Nocardia jejuensis]